MKKILPLLFIFISASVSAQQNGGFENWTLDTLAEVPDEWISSAGRGAGNQLVSKSVDAHTGNFSIKLENVVLNGDSSFGFFANDDVGDDLEGGQGFTENADTIRGWFKCDMQAGDSAILLLNFQNPTDTSTAFHIFAGGTVNTWTEFALPVNPQNIVPDTVLFALASTDAINEKGYQAGSWIQIDDLKLYKSGQPVSGDLFNPGFENWTHQTAENPDFWSTLDFYQDLGLPVVTKSNNSYSGNYALELSTVTNFDDTAIGLLTNGMFSNFQIVGGQPFSGVADSVRGQFIYQPSGADTAYLSVQFKNNGSVIGGNAIAFTNQSGSYMDFSFAANLFSTPDTVLITIFAGDNPGSVLTLDDIMFTSGPVGIDQNFLSQVQIYPNPTSGRVNVALGKHDLSQLDVRISDLSGKTVYVKQVPLNGNQVVEIDISNLARGQYLMHLTNESEKLSATKMISKD
ncbi:MAG: T9SS type A sorting domain-containing protein [Flavobacteriales bacterium]|nr:T9SS type A sorting domain-containing protein [Flavobacteriales bacterium]